MSKKLRIGSGLLDLIYPVGSIYMSVNSANPNIIFGGVWEQIKDRFLYCSNTSKIIGGNTVTGSHTLTASESGLPNHNHVKNAMGWTGSDPAIWIGSGNYTTIYFGKDTDVTGSTGGWNASNGHTHPQNLPPYYTVYCWYRKS